MPYDHTQGLGTGRGFPGDQKASTPWEANPTLAATLSASSGTPLDDFDQMLAALTDRVLTAGHRLSNRADRLFGYRDEVVGSDTAAKSSSVSEALAILNGAVTDLEYQLQRFY